VVAKKAFFDVWLDSLGTLFSTPCTYWIMKIMVDEIHACYPQSFYSQHSHWAHSADQCFFFFFFLLWWRSFVNFWQRNWEYFGFDSPSVSSINFTKFLG
jgi:hypothetical protein